MSFDWKVRGDELVMTTDGWSEEKLLALDYGIQVASGDITEEEVPEDIEYFDFRNLGDMEYELLPEDLFVVFPEDVGALTDSILLSTNYSFQPGDSDDPEDMSTCTLFWYPNYAIRSYLEDLVRTGEAVWTSE